ncbi:hypothetical protein BS47DRAFT_1360292 [Hydnum rufescens UP504]|uniref:Uncharacterized protein n=1 Tax=Hydnum rufescens UP504 TaxID=1448309 RepID=A0A9P6B2I7_9AGAM|nr:hypothetical protein BS47DRAFT_1360292 [Hydnum rufescens UP504]
MPKEQLLLLFWHCHTPILRTHLIVPHTHCVGTFWILAIASIDFAGLSDSTATRTQPQMKKEIGPHTHHCRCGHIRPDLPPTNTPAQPCEWECEATEDRATHLPWWIRGCNCNVQTPMQLQVHTNLQTHQDPYDPGQTMGTHSHPKPQHSTTHNPYNSKTSTAPHTCFSSSSSSMKPPSKESKQVQHHTPTSAAPLPPQHPIQRMYQQGPGKTQACMQPPKTPTLSINDEIDTVWQYSWTGDMNFDRRHPPYSLLWFRPWGYSNPPAYSQGWWVLGSKPHAIPYLGISHKQVSIRAKEWNEPPCVAFVNKIAEVVTHLDMLLFTNESLKDNKTVSWRWGYS